MTFLPIVERELRVAARRAGTYWLRGAAALVAVAAAAWVFLVYSEGAPKDLGMAMFVTLTVVANIFALLAGLRTTADCLSEEKREGTLGLLFLTDLKGYDIVLGKLAATSLNALYGLIAIFPMMALPILLGGVALGEFVRVAGVTLNNLLFSLAVGMFCSSVSRDDQRAGGATLGIVIAVAALPGFGELVREWFRDKGWACDWVLPVFFFPSPAFSCYAAFDAYFSRASPMNFFFSAGTVFTLSCGFLLAACRVVRRGWQDKPARSIAPDRGWRAVWERWKYGPPETRTARRAQLLQVNPVLWLTSRDRFESAQVWVGLGLLAALWVWGALRWPADWIEATCVPTAVIAHTLLKVWLAGQAGRRFSEDRNSGALELLLATPLSVGEIVQGQRLALWRQFAGPAVAVLLADFALLWASLGLIHPEPGFWILLWLAGMGMFVWDLFALGWVGMWMGLNSRRASRATSAALVRICVLPWLLFAVLMTWVGLLEITQTRWLRHVVTPSTVVIAWFTIGAALNALFVFRAKSQLATRFREVATQRFEARPSGAWGRRLGEWLARQRRGESPLRNPD